MALGQTVVALEVPATTPEQTLVAMEQPRDLCTGNKESVDLMSSGQLQATLSSWGLDPHRRSEREVPQEPAQAPCPQREIWLRPSGPHLTSKLVQTASRESTQWLAWPCPFLL